MKNGDNENGEEVMEISDEDGDYEIIDQKDIYGMIDRLEDEEMKKVPSLCSDDLDEHDTSGAYLMIIDGPSLKKIDEFCYDCLLHFWFKCLRKRNLPLFTHPGEPDFVDGGLVSIEGTRVRNNKECIELAEQAVTQYNQLAKAKKLEFEKLVKVNAYYCFEECYLTFSAKILDTGESGLYQAALKKFPSQGHLLGLLIECSTEKILVIMSITGAEKELAANRKFFEEIKAMEKKKKI